MGREWYAGSGIGEKDIPAADRKAAHLHQNQTRRGHLAVWSRPGRAFTGFSRRDVGDQAGGWLAGAGILFSKAGRKSQDIFPTL